MQGSVPGRLSLDCQRRPQKVSCFPPPPGASSAGSLEELQVLLRELGEEGGDRFFDGSAIHHCPSFTSQEPLGQIHRGAEGEWVPGLPGSPRA